MVKRTIVVHNSEGLHTRPANRFVRLAKQHDSDVTVAKNGTEAPGRSLLKIMKLGVVQGDTLEVRCDGPDEAALLAAIEELLS